MRANSFGNLLTFTSFGESHGPMIGVVIEGCPSQIPLSATDLRQALLKHYHFKYPFVTQRKEKTCPKIVSGVYEGFTTGTPICILMDNTTHDSTSYSAIEGLYRPGHASFAYKKKFGIVDDRGGGRASARECAAKIIVGVIARKLLLKEHMDVVSFVSQIGPICTSKQKYSYEEIVSCREKKNCFCPDKKAQKEMCRFLHTIREEKDSIGGEVTFCTTPLQAGLGDPTYESLDGRIVFGLMSIPGVKGVEIGSGRNCVLMRGSEHNDVFVYNNNRVETKTNHSGGILGGISTGMPIYGKVFFKPPSGIGKPMKTLSLENREATLQFPSTARHDVCIAIRGLLIVESIIACVLADALLLQKVYSG